jgi:hypothetical protein
MHFKHLYRYMNYHYCDHRYYVHYTEIEWHKCLLSGLRRRNPPASPLSAADGEACIGHGAGGARAAAPTRGEVEGWSAQHFLGHRAGRHRVVSPAVAGAGRGRDEPGGVGGGRI